MLAAADDRPHRFEIESAIELEIRDRDGHGMPLRIDGSEQTQHGFVSDRTRRIAPHRNDRALRNEAIGEKLSCIVQCVMKSTRRVGTLGTPPALLQSRAALLPR
jgi:hypothetical protein